MITVTTEDALKNALKNKESEIEVTGPLAEKIIRQRKNKKRATYGGIVFGVASFFAAPFTGGLSLFGVGAAAAAVAVAELTGTEIIMLVAVVGVLGLGLLGLLRGYNVEVDCKGTKVKLTRK